MKYLFKFNLKCLQKLKILFFIALFQLYIFFISFFQRFNHARIFKIHKAMLYNKNKIMTYQEPILPNNLSLFTNISSAKEFDKCLLEEFAYSKIHYKESQNDNIDLIKHLNIIVMMFVGRKKFLEYNLNYIKKLLANNLISEVHLWLYTKNENDTNYIKDNSNLYRTCGKNQNYNEIFTEIEENTFNISFKTNNNIFIKLNNIYEIILNNNTYNYINIYENNRIKNKISFNLSINFSEKNFINLKISIKDNSLFIQNSNNKKYFFYKNIENIIITKIEIKSEGTAFWKYTQIKNKGIFLLNVHNKKLCANMREAYYYYLNIYFDIIIKIDDDIIYFSDLDSFSRYVYFTYLHPEVSCVYSNSLNNVISFTYSGFHGLIDNYLTEKRRKTIPSLFKYSHFYTDFESAEKLHYSFIENSDKYLQKLRMPINIDKCFNINYKTINGSMHPFYISANVFALNKKNYDIIFNPKKIKGKYFWDEGYLVFKVKKKVFYPNFYSIHIAFTPQRKSKIFHDEEILEKYKKLLNHSNY